MVDGMTSSIDNPRLADGALQSGPLPHEVVGLQHYLSPIVVARLANVVRGLRSSWIAGPAQLWGDIHPIGEIASGEFEKRIATALRGGFLQCSHFFCQLEILLLELQQLGVVSEKTVLRLEKMVVDLADRRGELIEVPYSDRGPANVFGCRDGGGNDANEGVVHG